jgi:hypothetical protein
MNLIRRLKLFLPVLAIVACRNTLQPDLVIASGSYSLQATIGRGAKTGTVVLRPNGSAERRVRYPKGDGSLSSEFVALGIFAIGSEDSLQLALRENAGASSYVWRPRTTLSRGTLRIEYPDAADGPNIVETYGKR